MFLDTSGLLSLYDSRDAFHDDPVREFRRAERLLTHNYVLAELVALVKTQREYRAALRRAEELMDAKSGTPQGEELELLAALIEIYEEEHSPVLPPNPVEAILFRMGQENLRPQDLVPMLGSRSRVSEVLNGRRPLTLTMIRRLHRELGIPADVLLGEVETVS
jgi:HTH-type transcriptional regulator / antitoxin HigA